MKTMTFRRNAGLGTHRFISNGQTMVIAAGQKVTCSVEDLGSRLSQYTCLSGTLPDKQVVAIPPRGPEIVPNEKAGFYDVVNPDFPDKPLNETPLRKKSAVTFLESL